MTTVNLRQKFLQLKKFLTIQQQAKTETHEELEALRSVVAKLQEELTQQTIITQAISQESMKTRKELESKLAKLDDKAEKIEQLERQLCDGEKTIEQLLEIVEALQPFIDYVKASEKPQEIARIVVELLKNAEDSEDL